MSLATATPSIASSRPPVANDVGTLTTAAQAAGVSKKEYGNGVLRQTLITLSNTAITVTDTGGANGGYGSLQLLDLPAGHVVFVGAVSNFTSIAAASGIGATAAVKHSVGTAAEATNDTLDSTQANILPSTSVTLAASAGTGGGVNTAVAFVDGTSTANDVFLNIGVADAGISANSSVTISGTILVTWALLGDK